MRRKIRLISLMMFMLGMMSLAFWVSGQTPAAVPQQSEQKKLPPKEDPLETRVFKLEGKIKDLEWRIYTLEDKMRH